jgi:hypothetical protein
MSAMTLPSLISALLAAFATVASAETIEIRTGQQPALQPSVEQVRVSVGVNMFVAASTDAGDEALKAQETGRRLIYNLAAHECVLLRDVLASDCRLESINVNIQRTGNQFGNQQRGEGFAVNGNIGLRIVPK